MGRTKTIPSPEELAKMVGITHSAAYKRITSYKNDPKRYTYEKLMAARGKRSFVVLSDGRQITSTELSEIKGCNKNHACVYLRRFRNKEITEEELLSETRHSAKYGRRVGSGSGKQRLHNLNKIPEPSAWERENML